METGEAPKTKPKRRSAKKVAQILERGTKVFELRKSGASLRAISRELTRQAEAKGESTRGYSYEQVRKDFQAIVDLRIDEQQNMVDEARILAAERLDDVIINLGPILRTKVEEKGSTKTVRAKIAAGNAIVRATNVFAELYGAKRPLKVEHSGEIEFNWAQIAKEANDFSNLTDADHERPNADDTTEEPD